MKKLFMLLFFVAAITFTVKAQMPEKSPEKRAAHLTKVLSKTLNLTADQATKINEIFLTRAIEIDSLKSNGTADKKTGHLNRQQVQINADEQVMGVLNSDQQKQYLQWQATQKEKQKDKKGKMDPGNNMDEPAQG